MEGFHFNGLPSLPNHLQKGIDTTTTVPSNHSTARLVINQRRDRDAETMRYWEEASV